ncbi:deoxyribose-phosphate aldolase [Novosphingobium nitrogenifigens DSM 19370]|uniref:Deoxyribose-phosphate aldolase n=1 Tax=Novosphingobium nitrogenifigens DSM 19370 TaxID=983920 RepID=F1Z3N6_9SPHN|nr:hypothetical protein [Novosphingobium nitrogenifigens]EGD60767.1 deoxyribose-phosphate aldolase [Novosphingobium nitrogenifigens DSM 19370]
MTQASASDDTLRLNLAQLQGLGTVSLDHPAAPLSIATVDFATLDAIALNVIGITLISGIDGALTITAPQLGALGAITLEPPPTSRWPTPA